MTESGQRRQLTAHCVTGCLAVFNHRQKPYECFNAKLYIDAWVGAQGPRDATRGGGEFLGFAGEEGTGTSPMDRGETGTVDRRSTRSCVVARASKSADRADCAHADRVPRDPAQQNESCAQRFETQVALPDAGPAQPELSAPPVKHRLCVPAIGPPPPVQVVFLPNVVPFGVPISVGPSNPQPGRCAPMFY